MRYSLTLQRRKPAWTVIVLAVFCVTPSVRATIINGDFEDGLTGWTVASGNWVVVAGTGGNHLALSDTGGFLQQDFTLPTGAQTIELDYVLIQSGPGGTTGPTDFVSMYLINPVTDESLIPPEAGFEFTNLFLNETQNGVGAVNSTYVTVTQGTGSDPDHVSIDLSHLPSMQSARLAFQFSDNLNDNLNSLLAVDNVLVTVPEPAAAWLLVAVAVCTGFKGNRSGSKRLTRPTKD